MTLPKLFVISAPSGCGKTTIARKILRIHPEIDFSVSATTRPRRNAEIHGKDYFFTTKEEFESYINEDKLVEWQKIYDYYYGTLKEEVRKSLDAGRSIIFDIDVLGALSIKKYFPVETILIFIDVPNHDVLIQRLKNRQTENEETMKKRIARVEMEFTKKNNFDYVVLNDDLQKAVEEVNNIIMQSIN